jgi:Peroxisomal biogenesis factor 11 (PEX11)
LTRASFFGYWAYDNLLILAKLKTISGDPAKLNKNGMYFWFVANVFSVISSIRNLGLIKSQAAYYRKLIKESPEKAELFKEKFAGLKAQKGVAIRGLLKSGFDGLTAASGAGLTEKVGWKLSDSIIGFNGVVSSLVACYELYPK